MEISQYKNVLFQKDEKEDSCVIGCYWLMTDEFEECGNS